MTSVSLGLEQGDLSTLLAILNQYVPKNEVWAFGSRVRGTARPHSDLDLVLLEGEKPLSLQTKAELRYALSESNLPIEIDLVEWSRVSPAFREVIEENHLVLKSAA